MAMTTGRPAPITERPGPIGWARKNLFAGWGNSIITLICLYLLWRIVPPFFNWAFVNAVWAPDPEACRAVHGVGACWGIIAEKWRLIFFGTYPFDEQWRPALMVGLLLALIAVSMVPAFWRRGLALAWAGGLLAMGVLMWGGVLGLPFVPTDQWGGLPLTLILSVNGIVFSFPLAIALALGRRSQLPVIRAVCTSFIELVRGVPLITVLFMASLMIPLFLPQGFDINKLLRAQVAVILFSAAYLAEVVRAGLQAIPKGQFEAADSLGLSYPHKMSFVVLPQALRLVIPPMVNSFIAGFKDTSLVIIIGLFDLLGTTRLAANDPAWRPFYVEGLIFLALIYFLFCYTLARYSRYLETFTRKGERR
jgi:general L-amino acid transport system permease protein